MQQCFGEEIDSRLWQTLDLLCDTLKSILQRLAFEAWEVFLIVIGYFINACISKEDKSDVFLWWWIYVLCVLIIHILYYRSIRVLVPELRIIRMWMSKLTLGWGWCGQRTSSEGQWKNLVPAKGEHLNLCLWLFNFKKWHKTPLNLHFSGKHVPKKIQPLTPTEGLENIRPLPRGLKTLPPWTWGKKPGPLKLWQLQYFVQSHHYVLICITAWLWQLHMC